MSVLKTPHKAQASTEGRGRKIVGARGVSDSKDSVLQTTGVTHTQTQTLTGSH